MADEYVKLDDVLKLLNRNSITKTITFSDGISIYDSVQNLPTADVVPRAEVANEVFDEVLKTLFEMQKRYESIGHRGRVEQTLIARENILKLQRKYTDATDTNVGHKTKKNKKDAVTDVPIQLSIFDKEDNQ
jgi:hypothetical protein